VPLIALASLSRNRAADRPSVSDVV
jgi:hypothetical protein